MSKPRTPHFPGGPASHPHPDAHTEQRIRTFHPRRGRVTHGQRAALERRWADWGVDLDGTPLDLDKLFADADLAPDRPVVLEIGFGMGDATAAMAAADPGTGILAADVHTPARATSSTSPSARACATSGSPTATPSSCCATCSPRVRWPACGSTSPTRGPRPGTTSAA